MSLLDSVDRTIQADEDIGEVIEGIPFLMPGLIERGEIEGVKVFYGLDRVTREPIAVFFRNRYFKLSWADVFALAVRAGAHKL